MSEWQGRGGGQRGGDVRWRLRGRAATYKKDCSGAVENNSFSRRASSAPPVPLTHDSARRKEPEE